MTRRKQRLSGDELHDAFTEMTLIELSAFVKQFEETFGVTAAAPVAVAATPVGGSADTENKPGRVRCHPGGCRGQEDQRDQGSTRSHQARPQGG